MSNKKPKQRLYELHMSNKDPRQLAISHGGGPLLENEMDATVQLGRDVFVHGVINVIDGLCWLLPDNGSFEHDRIHLLPGHRLLMKDLDERLEGEE